MLFLGVGYEIFLYGSFSGYMCMRGDAARTVARFISAKWNYNIITQEGRIKSCN